MNGEVSNTPIILLPWSPLEYWEGVSFGVEHKSIKGYKVLLTEEKI